MKVIYARISTPSQNYERQIEPGIKAYIDICSGLTPFRSRPQAKALINNPEITLIEVDSIDRLGRNVVDILSTLEYFTARGINIFTKNQGLFTLLPNGKTSPMALMMFACFGAIAQNQKEEIAQRTRDGIEIAKAKNKTLPFELRKYKGRPRGTHKTKEQLAIVYKEIIDTSNKLIPQGNSILSLSNIFKGKPGGSRANLIKLQKEGLILTKNRA